MILEVYREYQGVLQEVGVFTDDGEAIVFSYVEEYLERSDAVSLSVSLPLQKERYSHERYQGFFEGLLPEGKVRNELAYRFRISPSDYLGMLRHLEDESIGALVFRNPARKNGISDDPKYRLIDDETLLRLVEFPVESTAQLAERGRFSLAGAQTKIGVYREDKADNAQTNKSFERLPKCYLPEGAAPSTHILKIPEHRFKELPANELFCLSTARNCGVDVCEATICLIGESEAFITRRFDRVFDNKAEHISGLQRPLRLHQEDFCQALGFPSYRKYETESTDNYPAIIASLLERVSGNVIEDKRRFVRQVIFDYLIGNCDNHLKNFSLMYSPDWRMRSLAPAYDIVCTTVLGYSREMGISIGDTRTIDNISSSDWTLFAQDLRIPKKLIVELIEDVIVRYEKSSVLVLSDVAPKEEFAVVREIIEDAEPRFHKLKQVAIDLS